MARTVKAVAMGFYKGARIRPGKIFSIGDNEKLGKWMVAVGGKPPAVAESAKADEAKAVEVETSTTDSADHSTSKSATGDKALADMSYPEMLAMAKALGITYEQNPKKADLMAMIEQAQKETTSLV